MRKRFNTSGACFQDLHYMVNLDSRAERIIRELVLQNKYFTITQMPIISGRYWNMVHGGCPEDVLKDTEGLQNMRFLARNMAYYLKCIEAGKKAGIELPKQEEVTFTNFIQ